MNKITIKSLKNAINFSEVNYNDVTYKREGYVTFNQFLSNIVDICIYENGNIDDAIFIAEDVFKKISDERKSNILESMKILIQEGEPLCSGSDGDFTAFAEENNYPLYLVKEVYQENKEELNELYNER